MEQSVPLDPITATEPTEHSYDGVSAIAEILEKEGIAEETKRQIIRIVRKEEFKGPLPHPSILKQYDEIDATFSERIMKMAENEQRHRNEMERKIVESEVSLNDGQLSLIASSIKLKSRLQWFLIVLTLLFVAVAVICLFTGRELTSIIPIILAIGTFFPAIYYNKRIDSDETKNK